jgi:hypothetical protein
MAVDFYRGVNALLHDLSRSGYNPELIEKTETEDRVLAASIRILPDTIIHWDRESRSVWAEGPWRNIVRVERRLRKLYRGGIIKRSLRRPKVVAATLLAIATLLSAYLISTSHDPIPQGAAVAPPANSLPAEPASSGE